MSLSCEECVFHDEEDGIEEDKEDWRGVLEEDLNVSTGSTSCSSGQVRNTSVKDGPHSRTVIHVDVDCFYAQVEMVRHPNLRNKPMGVYQKHLVVTANYPARERGVGKMASIRQAREVCPDIVLINGEDLEPYREVSYKMSDILQRWSPLVERLGLDDNFVDVTETLQKSEWRHLLNKPTVKGHTYTLPGKDPVICLCGCRQRLIAASYIASAMRKALQEELSLTCCAGIANNKLLCRLVAKTHKPNQQTTIFSELSQARLLEVKMVQKIPGIGSSAAKQLEEMNIKTVQDLRDISELMLEKQLGQKAARTMKQLSVGVDSSPVLASGPPQSLSVEDSFNGCKNTEDAFSKMETLLKSLINRQVRDGRNPQTLRVSVRWQGERYRRESRQCPIPCQTFVELEKDNVQKIKEKVLPMALSLLTKLLDTGQATDLRVLNVCFTKLIQQSAASSITNFFSPKTIAPETSTLKSDINVMDKNTPHLHNTFIDTSSITKFFSPRTATSKTKAAKDDSHGLSNINTCNRLHGSLANPVSLNKTTSILDSLHYVAKGNCTVDIRPSDVHKYNIGPNSACEAREKQHNAFASTEHTTCTTQVNHQKRTFAQTAKESDEHNQNKRQKTFISSKIDKTVSPSDKLTVPSNTQCRNPPLLHGVSKSVSATEWQFEGTENRSLEIDHEVFRQLPREIQEEIIAQQAGGIGTNHSSGSDLNQNLQHSLISRNNKDNTDVPSFNSDHCNSDEISPSDIPSGMDRSVFLEIPVEMQKQLVKDWKLSKEFKEMRQPQISLSSRKKNTTIAKYFKKM